MSSMEMTKDGQEFNFWGDLFKFRKKFYEIPTEKIAQEMYWQEIIIESDALANKYKDADFNQFGIVKKQILDIVSDLELKAKVYSTAVA